MAMSPATELGLITTLRATLRKHAMLAPGDRVAVALSGGADSVSLLLALHALKAELGIALSVAHFDHLLRPESKDDAQFTRELAGKLDLEYHAGSGDVRAYATQKKLSIEAAARELRYAFFRELLATSVHKIATAHTLDDQAETVLMKLSRGAGSRGLAGVAPVVQESRGQIIRPLLETSRADVIAFLESASQSWREDLTNADVQFTRNLVRHELLPLLEAKLNPDLRRALAATAEIARAEEEYFAREVERMLPFAFLPGEPSRSGRSSGVSATATGALQVSYLQQQPIALQRRIVRAIGERLGIALDFEHTERIRLEGAQLGQGKKLPLPGGWQIRRSIRELRFEPPAEAAATAEYAFPVQAPSTHQLADLQITLHFEAQPATTASVTQAYNRRKLSADEQLVLRNWRAGDRFQPPHSSSPKKVKELLQPMHLSPDEKAAWPVLERVTEEHREILWLKGVSRKNEPVCQLHNGDWLIVREEVQPDPGPR